MDGLECSEIQINELEFSMRIDSEYYQKIHLLCQEQIRSHDYCALGTVAEFLIGPFGSAYDTSTYVEHSDYRYIRGQDVKPFLLQDASPRYMAEDDFFRLRKYALSENDILISVVGTLGNACIIRKEELSAIFSCKSSAVKATSINPHYLLAYLNSTYGHDLLLRKARGAIQKGLNLDDLKMLEIPLFSDALYDIIEHSIKHAFICLDKSKLSYQEAEECFASALYLERNYEETSSYFSIKTLVESFTETGRLDAEYYQSKFDAYLETIVNYAGGHTFVGSEFDQVTTKCNRELDRYKYIEIGDVSVETGSAAFNEMMTDDLPENAKIMTSQFDVIVSTVRPNRGAVAILEEDGLLVSGAFTVLRTRGNYSSEVLQVLLRTEMYRDWLLRYNVGTSYPVIKDEDVLNMPLPVLADTVQSEIVAKIQTSVALRRQSELLFEYAKQAVELAIEEGEYSAIAWLKGKVE